MKAPRPLRHTKLEILVLNISRAGKDVCVCDVEARRHLRSVFSSVKTSFLFGHGTGLVSQSEVRAVKLLWMALPF